MNYESLSEEEKQQIYEKAAADRNEKDVQLLINTTEHIQFFKNYNSDPSFKNIHRECCKNMEYEFVQKQNWVFEIDSIGTKFYLILGGSVSIWIYPPEENERKKENLVYAKTLQAGDSFGELALMSKKPRLASIKADEDCHFAILEKEPFKEILLQAENEKLLKEMGFFAELPLFKTWNFNLIKNIYLNSTKKIYKRGEKVFVQDGVPNKIYIVSSGEYTVYKEIYFDCIGEEKYIMRLEDDQFSELEGKNLKVGRPPKKKIQQISTFAAHELFGEEDILNRQQKRTFTVECHEEGMLLEITKSDLIARIMSQHCSAQYLKERLKIKEELMKTRLENISDQLKIATKSQFEDQYLKMRIKSPLKENYKEKLYNNDQFLKSGGVVPRKFSGEELKRYNKKFDDELEKRRIEEEKKSEFLAPATKRFLHKLQYQFQEKLGSDQRVKSLQSHIRSSSVIESMPFNMGRAPTLKELREEYEDEIPKVLNKATLKYFLKKSEKLQQKSEPQFQLKSLNNIPSLTDITLAQSKQKNKTFQNLYKNSLDDISFNNEEDLDVSKSLIKRNSSIPSLNHLPQHSEIENVSLSKNLFSVRDSRKKKTQSEVLLIVTDEKNEQTQYTNQQNQQKNEQDVSINDQSFFMNERMKQSISPKKYSYNEEKHKNIIKLLNDVQPSSQFSISNDQLKQIRKTSNQSSNLNDSMFIDTSKYFACSQSPVKTRTGSYRYIRSSNILSRIQTPLTGTRLQTPLTGTNISALSESKKHIQQSFLSTQQQFMNKQTNNPMFYATAYRTPSCLAPIAPNSPFQVVSKVSSSIKTMTDLSKLALLDDINSDVTIPKKLLSVKSSEKPTKVSFSVPDLPSEKQANPAQQEKQEIKPICNFMITNSVKKSIKPQTTNPVKKKRVIYI